MLERTYVAGVRGARAALAGTRLLDRLEAARDRRVALWMRSLFAIYDIEDMAALDLPWWTFQAIDRTERFLAGRKDARVLEYGSGASTLWLARRAAAVFSIEHDEAWGATVQALLGDRPNVTLRLVSPDAFVDSDPRYISAKPAWRGRSFRRYVHAVDTIDGQADLIVVDGRARPACLAHARSRLKPDGMILFDNSHRPAYRRAIAASGMAWSRYRGLTPCLPYPDETTLLMNGG